MVDASRLGNFLTGDNFARATFIQRPQNIWEKREKFAQKGEVKNRSMERKMNLATFDRRNLKLTEKILKYSTLNIFHSLFKTRIFLREFTQPVHHRNLLLTKA